MSVSSSFLSASSSSSLSHSFSSYHHDYCSDHSLAFVFANGFVFVFVFVIRVVRKCRFIKLKSYHMIRSHDQNNIVVANIRLSLSNFSLYVCSIQINRSLGIFSYSICFGIMTLPPNSSLPSAVVKSPAVHTSKCDRVACRVERGPINYESQSLF